MATTEHFYTGNGSTTTYAYTFPYYKTSDIKVTWDDVAKTESQHYNVTGTNIVFTSGNIPGNGVAIHIYRDTDVDTSKATFAAGSSIRATDLNNNETQLLYSAQENQSRLIRTAEIKDSAVTSAKIKDGTIATADIADSAITAAKIAADAVGASEIVANAVGASELANNAVDTAAIVDDAVTGAKIGTGQVGADNLADNAVTTAKLNNTSVTADKIASDAVITAKLDTGAVTAAKLASDAVTTVKILDNNVTTAKIGNNQVTEDKMAVNSVNSDQYVDGSIDTVHIGDSQVTTAKLENNAVTNAKMADDAIGAAEIQNGVVGTVKITDDAITRDKIAPSAVGTLEIGEGAVTHAELGTDSVRTNELQDNAVTTAKIAASAVTHAEILNGTIGADKLDSNSVTTAKITDSNVTTAKIADAAIGTAKIANDAVTADKIADAVIVTASEQASHSVNDTTFFTTSAAEARYFNASTGETIKDGDTFPDNDTTIATTAAINDRIIDLVDDVGGFVPIANETSFPNANPDVNNGTGTLVSIKALSSNLTSNGSGVATIANGTVGNSTVTITGLANSTTYLATYGMIVETTSTLNTYTFHRQVPIATEISTVAGSISNVNTVATNISNVNTVASNNSNVTTTAGSIANVNLVGGSITNVNEVADNIGSVNDFAARYRTGSSNPSSSLDVGDLFFNTTANELKVYNGSEWQGGVTATGNFAVTTGNTFTGNNDHNDNVKIRFGTDDDLQIFHDGSDSWVRDTGTGRLLIDGSEVHIRKYGAAETMAKFIEDGAVELYYDNVKKFETTSTGYKCGDDVKGVFGAGDDFQIYHSTSLGNVIGAVGGHTTKFYGPQVEMYSLDGTKKSFVSDSDAAVELYHNNSKKLETSSSGITVSGNANIPDGSHLYLGASNDLDLYHAAGADSFLITTSGQMYQRYANNLYIQLTGSNENAIVANANGAVELYYDGVKKLETLTNGAKVTGNLYLQTDDGTLLMGASNDYSLYHDGTNSHINNDTGQIRTNSDWRWADNKKINVGSGNDLQIYHDGNNSFIKDAGTGRLSIVTSQLQLTNSADSEVMIKATENGAVELYYDNAKTFTTNTNACTVWGTEGNNATLYFHADEGDDWPDYWNLTATTDAIFKQQYRDDSGGFETSIESNRNGNVELYYDNSKKFETNSQGIIVGGDVDNSTSTQGVALQTGGKIRSRVANTSADAFIVSVEDSGGSKVIINGAGNGYFVGGLDVPDSAKIQAGDGDDLQIFHDGSHSYIDNSTGELQIRTAYLRIRAKDDGEDIATFNDDAGIELYYDGTKRFETVSYGIKVTGHYYADDNYDVRLGTGSDMKLYHDGSNSYIANNTGALRVLGSTFQIKNAANNEIGLEFTENGSVDLYYDGNIKCYTTATGFKIHTSAHLHMGDASEVRFGDGDDFTIQHNGSDSTITNQTGNLRIRNAGEFQVTKSSTENMLIAKPDGAVELYYDNNLKISTVSDGVRIDNGHLRLDRDDAYIKLGAGNDLQIWHDGSNSHISDRSGTGALRISSDNLVEIKEADANNWSAKFNIGGAAELYHNNAKVFETLSYGARVKRPSGGSTDFEVIGCEGQNAYIHMYADEGDDNADKWRLCSETGNNAFWIQNYAGGDWEGSIEARGNGTVSLRYDNSIKLITRSDGVRVDDNLLVNTDSDDANINDSSGESQFSMRGNGQGLRLSTSGPSYWNAFSSAEYHIRFRRQGSNTGNIYGESNGTTTFNTGSDYRLKQNVTAYTDGITKLKKLKPCEFEFKLEPGKVVDGFIAHEVTDAGFPWIVKGTKDAVESDGKIDPQSMDYSKLTPILTAALQEAITKIETLEAKVAALESS